MRRSMEVYTILVFCSSSLYLLMLSTAADTITMSQSMRDRETIVSAGGSFELGFFRPGNSTRRYLGIWYKKISSGTVVWVANREIPLFDSAGVLKVTNESILILLNHNKSVVWSTNSSRSVLNPVAQLLDSGNLVVRDANDENPESYLWQSFDYICDTLLPGMKVGWNTVTGLERYLSSWKSADDPSPGDFTRRLDPHGFPQLVQRKGPVLQFRLGPWNGIRFSGTVLSPHPIFHYQLIINHKEMYYTTAAVNSSVVSRMVLNHDGRGQRLLWIDRTQEWNLLRTTPADRCDTYAVSGANSLCDSDLSPEACGCLKGFVPKFQREWDISDYSNGCVRRTPLVCRSRDGFMKHSGIKFPDTRYSWYNESMTLKECKFVCLKNCSCMAYTRLDIRDGRSGCLLWFGDLIDIRAFLEDTQEIYIRMAFSEVGMSLSHKPKNYFIHGTFVMTGIEGNQDEMELPK